jgi:hypothetical protein
MSTPPPTFGALGAIPLDRFQRAADRFDLGPVADVAALGGAHGNNVGLTAGSRAWVLRAAVGPVTVDTLRRERFFAQTIVEQSRMAASQPYLIDESSGIFGWPYALMARLPGTVLQYTHRRDWYEVGHELGYAVAALHGIRFPHAGEWSPSLDAIAPAGLAPDAWFAQRFASFQQRLGETWTSLDADSRTLVERAVDAAIPTIEGYDPTYVHGDLGIANLVGHETRDGFAFTGVVDLGGGLAGDPDEDLAVPIWWPLYWGNAEAARSFIEGYRGVRPPRARQEVRVRAYVAISLLTNWDVGRRHGHDWYGGARTFHQWAAPLLDRVTRVLG